MARNSVDKSSRLRHSIGFLIKHNLAVKDDNCHPAQITFPRIPLPSNDGPAITRLRSIVKTTICRSPPNLAFLSFSSLGEIPVLPRRVGIARACERWPQLA